jgi:Zn-dependent protease
MKCQACMQETLLPFLCQHCSGQFCSLHRLPENHACPKIDVARAQRQGQVLTPQSYNSYNYSYVFGQDAYKRKHHIIFSQKEVKHITIAALLVIGIGFSIGLYGNLFGGFFPAWTWDVMAVFAVVMTSSFLVHELAHKVIAQKKGLWAEFRLTTWGAILTFASIFLPFRMIAPGAMMIGGSIPSGEDILKISLAGPITNIIFSSALLGLAFTLMPSTFAIMLFLAAYINAFMAVFNLIPFGILDGYKIFNFNKKIWALAFTVSAALTILTYLQTFGY